MSAGERDLLPCPFCGCTRTFMRKPTCDRDSPYRETDRAYPSITCRDCYVEVAGDNWDKSGKSAVAAWNRRAYRIHEAEPAEPAGAGVAGVLRRVIAQARTDINAAHAEICKLQGLDPAAHAWPEWSSPAHTLRWFDEIERHLAARPAAPPLPAHAADGRPALGSRYVSSDNDQGMGMPARCTWRRNGLVCDGAIEWDGQFMKCQSCGVSWSNIRTTPAEATPPAQNGTAS